MKNLLFARHRLTIVVLIVALLGGGSVLANIPGGGTGTGANVTLVDNGDGTVTMANGIVSIVITKADATIHQINYTYNNSGTPTTTQVLSGGSSGGELYWEFGGFSTDSPAYSVVANTGDYAEVDLLFNSTSSGIVDIHFSMLRGSTGFYVTPIWGHRSTDSAMSMGETRDNIYAGSIFNWMSVDAERNRLMEVSGGSAINPVLGAPVEVSLWTSGIYSGQYEDKYKYSADFGNQRVWGWSSVGAGGKNVGLWNVSASVEYYSGGPMKRELMEHIGTTILNMTHGSHYGGGTDSSWALDEVWTHVYGPYFIYCNNITNSITNMNQAAQALYADAQAQAAAESTAWPYSWFTSVADYAPASNRGTVAGQIAIDDVYNPNASASNLWVGVVQQPITVNGEYDFQTWCKPYQFWVKTDTNGNFAISNVIAGANYTLYAFGPGAAGTFQSQAQSGGSAPNSVDIPASPFSVTVTAGVTNDLGTVTWTPTRVGPTVFEIGYPNRTGDKFRHGEDWWVGDVGPSASAPSPIWSKWLEFPFDFPSGPNYAVGSSRWTTDWNFVQPVVTGATGGYNNSSSTITFNLPSAPSSNGSLYLALSSDFQSAIIINVNGTLITSSSGYSPAYSSSSSESDSTIREGIHGMYSDNRISVPSSALRQGQNTITISIRQTGGSYFADHAMYDYIRLELPGYVPPAPAGVAAYAGNNCNLISWPVTPGATGYNVLRTTTSGSGYLPITNGVTGPVCGSGWNNATFLDTTAQNGMTYYYVVQSVNSAGASSNSSQSPSATPSGAISTSAPVAPGSVSIGGVAHQSVTVNWSAAANASFYTVYRSTLVNNGGGVSNVLGTIVLANNVTGTTYTDISPTDGSIYSYSVTATGPGGTSGVSVQATAVPLPAPPATAPGSLTGIFSGTSVMLNWNAVPGAVGYVVTRSTSPSGPFNLVMSVTETTYTDSGLNPALTYYYQVTAMNAAGTSPNASVTVVPPPSAPVSLSAIPGNAQVILSWPSVPGVTGYYLYRGTNSGGENTLIAANYAGTSVTDTGVVNGTTYYYVVASTNANGLGPNSPEASATPSTSIPAPRSLTWRGDGSANIWDVDGASNWVTNSVATLFNNGDTVTFDNTGSNNVPVAVAGTPQPALVVFNSSKNYTLSGVGSISGGNQLIKMGSGTLTIDNTNLYSGGTIISNSTVLPGNNNANTTGWGTGPIILMGGTVQFNGYGGSTGTFWGGPTNALNVPSGRTGTLLLPPRFGQSSPLFSGPLTGGGTLNVTVDYVRDFFSGDWSAFTGQINVTPRSGTGQFLINNSAGYANAAIFLNNGTTLCSAIANQTMDIGELGGSSTAVVGPGGTLSSSNPTWRIGARNTTNIYAGTIQNSGVTSLIKIGTGMLVLSGPNTYSGGTTVSNGILMVSNSVGTATGLGPVTVFNGGALAGSGIISGAVTVNSGGALAPGDPLGALTLSNSLTLAAGSSTFVQLEHSPLANDAVNVMGALTEGGMLSVSNIGIAALANGDSFQLFNAASYSGAFSGYVLPPLTGSLRWNTSALNSSGVLSVIALTSPSITNLQMVNGSLVMSGSGGVGNWPYYLLSSTNIALPVAQWTPIATNQFDASGNFVLTNAVSTSSPRMFYQIQLQ